MENYSYNDIKEQYPDLTPQEVLKMWEAWMIAHRKEVKGENT
jgi:hypothetical protein